MSKSRMISQGLPSPLSGRDLSRSDGAFFPMALIFSVFNFVDRPGSLGFGRVVKRGHIPEDLDEEIAEDNARADRLGNVYTSDARQGVR